MSEQHVPYFPKRRDDHHERSISAQAEAGVDNQFHGRSAGDQYSVHSSFDYKPPPAEERYRHSQSDKPVPVYQGTVPVGHTNVIHPGMHIEELYDIEAIPLENAVTSFETHHHESHGSAHHDSGRHSHHIAHDHKMHHKTVHVDDPGAQQIIAHNHAMVEEAPTVLHSMDDGVQCTPRCLVSSFCLCVAVGIGVL